MSEVFDVTGWPLAYQLLSGLVSLLLAGGGTYLGVKKYQNGNGASPPVNGNGIKMTKKDYDDLLKRGHNVQLRQAKYMRDVRDLMKRNVENTDYLVKREERREILEEADRD